MTERYKRYVAAKLQKSGFTELKSIPNTEYITAKSKNGAKVCVQCLYSEFTVDTYDIESAAEAKTAYGCATVMVVTNCYFTDEAEALASKERVMLKGGISLPSSNNITAETKTKEKRDNNKEISAGTRLIGFLLLIIAVMLYFAVFGEWQFTLTFLPA